jgi:hypothetical protein
MKTTILGYPYYTTYRAATNAPTIISNKHTYIPVDSYLFNNIICPVDTNISVNLLKTVNMGILY